MPEPADVVVIVCTRDRPELLDGALEAIRAATPPAAEVLVVDSASRGEATAAVADRHGVHRVRSEVPGLSIARNLGLAATDRAIVVYTDDDCRPQPGWIDPLLAQFDDERVDAVTGRMLDHELLGGGGADGRAAAGGGAARVAADLGPAPVRRFTRTVDGLDAGHGALMAFRRERMLALGGFDPLLGAGRAFAGAEDLDALCRVLAAGGTVVADEAAVVVHANTRAGAAHARLYRGYGLGLGAMCAKWLRRRPGTGARMLVVLVRRALVRLVGGDRRRRAAQRALLAGILLGLVRARALPLDGEVFAEPRPAAPPRRLGQAANGAADGA